MQDWHSRAKTPDQVIAPNGRKVFRIVCLGGSTTQDMTAFVHGGITYPTELQRVLNERLGPDSDVVVETINAGFAAHSTMHMLILLQTELLALKPDLLIVYENVNDLMVNYFPGPTSPTYASKFTHPFYLPPEMIVAKATLLDHSRLYTWGRDRYRAVAGNEIRYGDGRFELAHAASFRTNLLNIHAIAQRHGIPVVFGLQAFAADQQLFHNHFKSKTYNDEIVYPRIDVLHDHFRQYHQIVREVANECGCLCADPYAPLLAHPEYFADVVHLRPDGARIVGQTFAHVLLGSSEYPAWLAARRLREATLVKDDRDPVPETRRESHAVKNQ
jgi:hypothetical protein